MHRWPHCRLDSLLQVSCLHGARSLPVNISVAATHLRCRTGRGPPSLRSPVCRSGPRPAGNPPRRMRPSSTAGPHSPPGPTPSSARTWHSRLGSCTHSRSTVHWHSRRRQCLRPGRTSHSPRRRHSPTRARSRNLLLRGSRRCRRTRTRRFLLDARRPCIPAPRDPDARDPS